MHCLRCLCGSGDRRGTDHGGVAVTAVLNLCAAAMRLEAERARNGSRRTAPAAMTPLMTSLYPPSPLTDTTRVLGVLAASRARSTAWPACSVGNSRTSGAFRTFPPAAHATWRPIGRIPRAVKIEDQRDDVELAGCVHSVPVSERPGAVSGDVADPTPTGIFWRRFRADGRLRR